MMEIDCIRKSCIKDPGDPYHFESHLCFVCGAEFDPSIELVGELCPSCGWLRCPFCGGCKCSLGYNDQRWIDYIKGSYCQDVGMMAKINVGMLPPTENPNVKLGLGIELRFCRRWANVQLHGAD